MANQCTCWIGMISLRRVVVAILVSLVQPNAMQCRSTMM
jgi:hypothetical protein